MGVHVTGEEDKYEQLYKRSVMGAKSWYCIGEQLNAGKPLYNVIDQYDPSKKQLVLKAYDSSLPGKVAEFTMELEYLTAVHTWISEEPIVQIVDHGVAYEGMDKLT